MLGALCAKLRFGNMGEGCKNTSSMKSDDKPMLQYSGSGSRMNVFVSLLMLPAEGYQS